MLHAACYPQHSIRAQPESMGREVVDRGINQKHLQLLHSVKVQQKWKMANGKRKMKNKGNFHFPSFIFHLPFLATIDGARLSVQYWDIQ
jgi:hypothetical protein